MSWILQDAVAVHALGRVKIHMKLVQPLGAMYWS